MSRHTRGRGGYSAMSPNDTRGEGEGGGLKLDKKFNEFFEWPKLHFTYIYYTFFYLHIKQHNFSF
jgi:hypothetical protein